MRVAMTIGALAAALLGQAFPRRGLGVKAMSDDRKAWSFMITGSQGTTRNWPFNSRFSSHRNAIRSFCSRCTTCASAATLKDQGFRMARASALRRTSFAPVRMH